MTPDEAVVAALRELGERLLSLEKRIGAVERDWFYLIDLVRSDHRVRARLAPATQKIRDAMRGDK